VLELREFGEATPKLVALCDLLGLRERLPKARRVIATQLGHDLGVDDCIDGRGKLHLPAMLMVTGEEVDDVIDYAPPEVQPRRLQRSHEFAEYCPKSIAVRLREVGLVPAPVLGDVDAPELDSVRPIEHLVREPMRGLVHVDGADDHQVAWIRNSALDSVVNIAFAMQIDSVTRLHRREQRCEVLLGPR
jgi:hypothetical protein